MRIALALGLLGGLAAAARLEIVQPALHQYESGPAVSGAVEFFPGDTVFLTFKVSGFALVEKANEESLSLSYEIDALDPQGVRLQETVAGKVTAVVRPEDKKAKWLPVVDYSVLVPPAAPPGEYRLALSVKDLHGGAEARRDVTFRVRGRYVEPSDTLVVRNFRFYRSEVDTRPLEVPAYRPGDTLWARFDITGYKLGPNNRFSIDYGLAVLSESGRVLYTQEVAAADERESFYPERHTQGSLSLSLTRDLAKGTYTILLTVRDHLGSQTYQTRQAFHVD
jgi:hypothetical protein